MKLDEAQQHIRGELLIIKLLVVVVTMLVNVA
jgi:hypothetical protein